MLRAQRAARKKNGCVSNRGCHDCHEWEGKGKDGNDQTLRVGNGMTGMTRNIRIRRDQVGYKRVWDCTWNWRGLPSKALGTSQSAIAISYNYRNNLTVTTVHMAS